MLELNAFDWTVIVMVLLSSAMGFARGILREIFTALAIVGATFAVLASFSFTPMGLLQPPWLEVVVVAAVTFVVVFIVIGIVTKSLAALLHKSAEITAIDRGAGLAYGFIRAALIVVLAVVLVRQITPPDRSPPALLTEAKLYPVLQKGAAALEVFIQDKRHLVTDTVDQAKHARSEDAKK